MEASAETAHSFGTTDDPLGIVVDHGGTIRFIGVLPNDAFIVDGYIEKVLSRIAGSPVRPLRVLP